jgi:serine phosphatase RsbU (regulator of sigma subunit)
MGAGDVLLMHTDGLSDHRRSGEAYFPSRLEALLRTVKDRSAKEIFEAIIADIVAFGPRSDDVGIVVVKLAM